ncbi:hypothetical protein GOP47_0022237 [Adiantum capillus-veneris]|uniref:Uncharacterized protein n=1 Tax=Adiantum capillus-veneris TaxID=13818 RepID=A0A9D4U9K5_ADICA|nr:hypothetical protein GOP47_0022237 [Adiantum capillus-veneris]
MKAGESQGPICTEVNKRSITSATIKPGISVISILKSPNSKDYTGSTTAEILCEVGQGNLKNVKDRLEKELREISRQLEDGPNVERELVHKRNPLGSLKKDWRIEHLVL